MAARLDDGAPYTDTTSYVALGRIGTVLNDKWRLDALLGVGGSAAVYAATHRSGARAAVKVLHPELTFNEELRARLNREARVLSVVDHPGAVGFIQQGVSEDGALYLVMELLDGETLTSYLARKGSWLEEEEARRIGLLVLDVLSHAHRMGIVHRDIKTDNVFITRSGQVKVLDFGIARLLERARQGSKNQTQKGVILGTPGSMPPEQAMGLNDQVDARSDVWSVGAMLFEMLTACTVHFQADNVMQQLRNAATKPAPKLRAVHDGVSQALANVVDRALAFDKANRFQDATEMQRALLAASEAVAPSRLKICFAPAPRPPVSSARKLELFAVHSARVLKTLFLAGAKRVDVTARALRRSIVRAVRRRLSAQSRGLARPKPSYY